MNLINQSINLETTPQQENLPCVLPNEKLSGFYFARARVLTLSCDLDLNDLLLRVVVSCAAAAV
jgi:hypothetical protein